MVFESLFFLNVTCGYNASVIYRHFECISSIRSILTASFFITLVRTTTSLFYNIIRKIKALKLDVKRIGVSSVCEGLKMIVFR